MWAKREGLALTSVAALLASADAGKLSAAVHTQLSTASKSAKLAGFEMVKKIHLEPEQWTVDNGMLTPTFKAKRVDLKKRYQKEIDAMYAEPTAAAPSKL